MKEFRPPRGALWGCLLFAAGWTIFGIWGVAAQILNVDGRSPHPVGGATFTGAMCLAIAGFGAFTGFKLHSERLLIGLDALVIRRWGRSHVLASNDVTHAEWRKAPTCGMLVLHTARSRFTISFEDYKKDRVELVSALRAKLPEALQKGWPEFEFRYFPDEVETQRRHERAEKPLSMWVVVPTMTFLSMATAGTLWLLIAEGFESLEFAWAGAGAVMLVGVLWTVFDWRRARRKQVSFEKLDSRR